MQIYKKKDLLYSVGLITSKNYRRQYSHPEHNSHNAFWTLPHCRCKDNYCDVTIAEISGNNLVVMAHYPL